MELRTLTVSSIGKDVENGNSYILLVRMYIGTTTLEKEFIVIY